MLRIIPVGVKVDITCSKCAFWVTADTMLRYINAHIDGDEDLMANIYKSRERDDA